MTCKRCNEPSKTGTCTHCLCIESDELDAEQIRRHKLEYKIDGKWVHILSDGSKVVSYCGILALAHKYQVSLHRTELERYGNWWVAMATAERDGMTRMSAKECSLDDDTIVAAGRAERNAMRQLIPHHAIKWLEMEYGFDWQVAYAECRKYASDEAIVAIAEGLYPSMKLPTLRYSQWAEIYLRCKAARKAA